SIRVHAVREMPAGSTYRRYPRSIAACLHPDPRGPSCLLTLLQARISAPGSDAMYTPQLCLMDWHRAKVTMFPSVSYSSVRYSCTSDDLPHTIPYHGVISLSSASRNSISY